VPQRIMWPSIARASRHIGILVSLLPFNLQFVFHQTLNIPGFSHRCRSQLLGGLAVETDDAADETRKQVDTDETRKKAIRPVEKKQRAVQTLFLNRRTIR